MRLLHLSDLHVTPPFADLADVWSSPAGAIEGQRFDAIILSGDLVQNGANREEYDRLEEFLRSTLAHLLEGVPPGSPVSDKNVMRRIVCVPGNHDVSWEAEIATPRSIARMVQKDDAKLRKLFKDLSRGPHENYRLLQSALGHIELHEVDPAKYPSRFENLQRFFDSIYGTDESDDFIPFRLCPASGTARHWSVHVFREARVVFHGFNSCELNDCYWTGAQLTARHIQDAVRTADRIAPHFNRVAVWHHGMTSEPNRPDALTLIDLGRLMDRGFSVGFHGHIHNSETEEIDRPLRDRFVRVAAGTVGAGAAERGDGVRRQFSVVRLHPRQLHVEVFEEQGAGRGFRPQPSRFHLLPRIPAPHQEVTRAGRHRRTWTIDKRGVARVRVEFETLDVSDSVVLAIVTPPFCQVAADLSANSNRGESTVRHDELPDGRFRYVMHGSDHHVDFSWEYMVSNAFALDRAQLALRESPAASSTRAAHRWRPIVQRDEEVQVHTVRIPCDELVLRVEFASEGVISSATGAVRAVVEMPEDDHGFPRWSPDRGEIARCRVDCDPNGRWCELRVEAPLVHHRYGLVFKLAHPGKEMLPHLARDAHDVLKLCRDTHSTGDGLIAAMNRATSHAMKTFVGDQTLSGHVTWLGLLWSKGRSKLYTAFGHFRHPSWNVRFSAGVGVAGHAFRFGCSAAWHRGHEGEGNSSESLIYQRQSELQGVQSTEYEWVICVPILEPTSQVPLGIFSIASDGESHDLGDRTLSRMAQELSSRDPPPQATEELSKLVDLVNLAFWKVVSEASTLHHDTRNRGVEALRFYERAATPSCPPEAEGSG